MFNLTRDQYLLTLTLTLSVAGPLQPPVQFRVGRSCFGVMSVYRCSFGFSFVFLLRLSLFYAFTLVGSE